MLSEIREIARSFVYGAFALIVIFGIKAIFGFAMIGIVLGTAKVLGL